MAKREPLDVFLRKTPWIKGERVRQAQAGETPRDPDADKPIGNQTGLTIYNVVPTCLKALLGAGSVVLKNILLPKMHKYNA